MFSCTDHKKKMAAHSRWAVVVLVLVLHTCARGSFGDSTTMDVLVAFRKAISADPTGALSSWATNETSANNSTVYCSWQGVVCNGGAGHVKSIQVAGRQLQGSITPMLGRLPYLSYLNLSFNLLASSLPAELGECTNMLQLALNDNQLSGSLPPELANLTRLQVLSAGGNDFSGALPALALPHLHQLNLSSNSLDGQLTTQLAGCASLRLLDLSHNNFQGSIPAALGNLSHLAYLDFSYNNLTSSTGLPPSLANCTLLYHLNLFNNHLTGSIPSSWFQHLRHLTFFTLGGSNYCNGTVPPSIASLSKLQYVQFVNNHFQGQILHLLLNCTSLTFIDLSNNSFTESLPETLGSSFPNLTFLGLELNNFYGSIPVSLGNCSQLQSVVMGFNYGISGTVPKELFRLQNLGQLDLQYNALTGKLPAQIGNGSSSPLFRLLLNNNNFTGNLLPQQAESLPALQQVNFEYNQFSGSLPNQLGNSTLLIVLSAYRNLLEGSIPPSFGQLSRLEHLILDNNQLSGPFPSSLSNCTRLTNVSLNNNLLQGGILAANLPNMLYFDLSNNRLSGIIPPQLGAMTQVEIIDLSFNNLSGSLPASLASCVNLYYLNLSSNKLTGSIPSNLGTSLQSLLVLNLSQNSISGQIPQELGNLTSLQKLDLSFNSLSGEIPDSLQNLHALSFLNVSYNNLEGAIPNTGPFLSFTPSSFLGNPRLCGSLLHISCPGPAGHVSKRTVLIVSLVVAGAVLVLLLMLSLTWLGFCARFFSTRTKRSMSSMVDQNSTHDLRSAFLRLTLKEIQEATNDFSNANILGVGGTGIVYKGITRDGNTLAFKKFLLPRSSPVSPFFAEIKALGQVRHRNLVRVLGYYSDLDNDILILQYMPNGNLGDCLHPPHNTLEGNDHVARIGNADHLLPWANRLRIAKGIAEGLAYLHHDCPKPIIHLDVKPNNILLDEDFDARITDFGLARVMQEAATQSSTQNMRGSLGYIAPEYASSGRISRKCDVYSYGIVLMEITTGKSPADEMFTEGATLVKWVQSCMIGDGTFQEHLVGISLGTKYSAPQRAQVNIVLNLALLCTKEDPNERPTMQKVAEMLEQKQLAIDLARDSSLES